MVQIIFILNSCLQTGNEKELEESYRNVPLYLQLIAIGILGPIIEEIIFRGIVN